MSLANLSIDVTVNTGQAQRGLREVGATAQEQFMRSGAAVDDFRSEILAASDALERASNAIGAGMDRAAQQITGASVRSKNAIEQIEKSANDASFDSFGEKVATALGAGFGTAYAATEEWMQKTEDFVVAKGKAIAIGVALAAAAAGAGAIYTAYRLVSGSAEFVKGLFTGDSYKSASIDSIIELNRQVETLQQQLQISAQHAHALLDATARLGVDPTDYSETYRNVTKAVRENADELERLGVQYKDADGKILSNQTILENAQKLLESYVEGYDRYRAAQALGLGTEQQIAAALKVTQAELAASKERLDAYNLALGPEGQQSIARYEAALREFNAETAKMSAGFKRVIADGVMPVLTDLAEFFRDGWPGIVNVFRVGVSTMVGLGYALKNGIYIVAESILGSLEAIGTGFGSLAEAAYKAMQGRFADAKDALVGGVEAAYERFRQIGTNIVAMVMHNDAAIRFAVGKDDRTRSIGQADDDHANREGNRGSKIWKDKDKPQVSMRSPWQTYLDDLDRMAAKVEQNEYASLRLKGEQLAQADSTARLADAYERINRVQRGESQKMVDQYAESTKRAAEAYDFETGLIGKNVVERELLTTAMREEQALRQRIEEAKSRSKPIDGKGISDMRMESDRYIARMQTQIQARDQLMRSTSTGISTALDGYVRSATDAAANVADVINGSFQRMENALVNFVHTGKINLGDLFRFMADEYLRQTIRMSIASNLGSGIGGVLGSIGSILGFNGMGATASLASSLPGDSLDNFFALNGNFRGHANGLDYVPYNGYPALLHEGEKVLTRQEAARERASSAAPVIDFTGQTLNVGSGVSRTEFYAALQANNAQLLGNLRRMRSLGELQ